MPTLNSRFRRLQELFHLWQMARRVSRLEPKGSSVRPVIFFNASTRLSGLSLNAAFSLLASWAVRLAGTPVIHFVCRSGMTHCILGTDEADPSRPMPCGMCVRQSRASYTGASVRYFSYRPDQELVASLRDLSLEELEQFERTLPGTSLQVPLGRLVLPSVRWRMRLLNVPSEEPALYIYRQFILSAWNVLKEFNLLLENTDPASIVIFNGLTFPEAVAAWLAEQRHVRVITHEASMGPLSAFFTDGEAPAVPLPMPAGFELDAPMEARLDGLLEKRFQGQFTMAGVRFYPEMQGLDAAFLEKARDFKQVVPIFTNVIFDTSQQLANAFFPNMFAWLDAVLEVIRRHPETLFVLRAHPDEARPGKFSRESVSMWVERSHAAGLPNLAFVSPTQFISSYELIGLSRFVMIYNSTIGLEASIMGKAVLCAGNSRFTPFDTVLFPASRQEYLQQLERLLSASEVQALPEHVRNARRVFYFHYFLASLPFGEFIEPSSLRGYVNLKPFDLLSLTPTASPAVRAVLDGILQDGNFILKE